MRVIAHGPAGRRDDVLGADPSEGWHGWRPWWCDLRAAAQETTHDWGILPDAEADAAGMTGGDGDRR
jgi:hypothetical protein